MDDRGRDLYWDTFKWEALAVLPRLLITFPLAFLLLSPLLLMSSSGSGDDGASGFFTLVLLLALLLGAVPLGLSLLALEGQPGGFRWTKSRMGAREPEPEELTVLRAAFAQLGVSPPPYLYVLDGVTSDAYVVGDAIYVTRELLDDERLAPILAHELGHLENGDGRLVLALRRFEVPLLGHLRPLGTAGMVGSATNRNPYVAVVGTSLGCLIWVLSIAGGGLGLVFKRFAWPAYWREREFLADRHAFTLGQGFQLIEALRQEEFFDIAVPYHHFVSDHPYVRQRIGRLQRLIEKGDAEPIEPTYQGSVPAPRRPAAKRTRGYTDEEAVLHLVAIEEDHAGWAEDVGTERQWMSDNGRRILGYGYTAHGMMGRGVVLMTWTGDPAERLSDRKFNYMRQSEHAKYLHSSTSPAMSELDPQKRGEWIRRVASYDPVRHVMVLIVRRDEATLRFGLSHYQLAPTGGGQILERIMELPPQE